MEDLRTRFDAMTEERDVLQARIHAADRELEAFGQKVVEVATEYATKHEWCSVIDQALQELGLERPPASYTATLEITVTFETTMRDRRDEPDRSWVRESIRTGAIRRASTEAFSMDSDHTNTTFNQIEFDVTEVELDD